MSEFDKRLSLEIDKIHNALDAIADDESANTIVYRWWLRLRLSRLESQISCSE